MNNIALVMKSVAPEACTILYGSEARGDARQDSDIDLLILINDAKLSPERECEITRKLYEIELRHNIIISKMIMPRKRWEERAFETPFTINVKREGIVL